MPPGAFFGGEAYLIYANQTFLPNSTKGSTISLASLGMVATTTPVVTNPLQGIVFSDVGVGDRLGYSVGSAGDFNSDGVDDAMLGAPGYGGVLGGSGYVYVAYGQTGTTTSNPTRINGIFTISPTTATAGLTATSFIGQANDEVGYSLASTTHIQIGSSTTAAPFFDILIGAPGNSQAYLVPGTSTGTTQLGIGLLLSTINTTLNGTQFGRQWDDERSSTDRIGLRDFSLGPKPDHRRQHTKHDRGR